MDRWLSKARERIEGVFHEVQDTDRIALWLAHALGGIGLVLIGRMVFIQMVP